MNYKQISNQSKSDWKRSWTPKDNKPFAQNWDMQRIRDGQQLNDFVEKQIDSVYDLDSDWLKNPQIAKKIFDELSKFTERKNEKNNQYLIDFKTRLLKEIKGKRSKDQIWDDLKRVYSQFTVHGQKSKIWLLKKTDIDGWSSLLLLELAWFKKDWIENINFVANWESWPGMNIDTSDGGVWWLKVEQKKQQYINQKWEKKEYNTFFNSILSLDEHWWWPCSSTRMIYEILKDFNKIPHNQSKQVARFVQFVDIVDDLWYQVSGVVPDYLERTIFGLYRFLPVEFIFDYFKHPNRTGFEYLDDDYLSQTKIRNFDTNWKFKWLKSLKKISLEKKDRVDRWFQEYLDLEKKWYFLMYRDNRFIVDLWAKITDWPETASIYGAGIIRIFPSGDVYIYSPTKLSPKIGWFEVMNDHFIIDKIWSGKNLNELLREFDYLATREFENSTDPGSKFNLKKEIINYRENLKKDNSVKKDQISSVDILAKEQIAKLPDLEPGDIEIWKTYKWIVNNKRWNIIFVTLDSLDQVRWILHKSKSWDQFSSIKVWEEISVIVEKKEDNKINFVLDNAIK